MLQIVFSSAFGLCSPRMLADTQSLSNLQLLANIQYFHLCRSVSFSLRIVSFEGS